MTYLPPLFRIMRVLIAYVFKTQNLQTRGVSASRDACTLLDRLITRNNSEQLTAIHRVGDLYPA